MSKANTRPCKHPVKAQRTTDGKLHCKKCEAKMVDGSWVKLGYGV